MKALSSGHSAAAALSMLFLLLACIHVPAHAGSPSLDVPALRKVRPLSPDSLYLIVPVRIGGCSKCLAENLARYQHVLDCLPEHLANRTVLLQLVKVGRMLEFTSLRNTYPDIEGMTPDIRSTISGTTFSSTNPPFGILLLGNEQIPLRDGQKMCETVRVFCERHR